MRGECNKQSDEQRETRQESRTVITIPIRRRQLPSHPPNPPLQPTVPQILRNKHDNNRYNTRNPRGRKHGVMKRRCADPCGRVDAGEVDSRAAAPEARDSLGQKQRKQGR